MCIRDSYSISYVHFISIRERRAERAALGLQLLEGFGQLASGSESYVSCPQLSSGWRAWRGQYEAQLTLRLKLQSAVGRMLNKGLSRGFGSWTRLLDASRAASSAARAADAHFRCSSLRRWRHAALGSAVTAPAPAWADVTRTAATAGTKNARRVDRVRVGRRNGGAQGSSRPLLRLSHCSLGSPLLLRRPSRERLEGALCCDLGPTEGGLQRLELRVVGRFVGDARDEVDVRR